MMTSVEWNLGNIGEREWVGLFTAILVTWNTYRERKQTKVLKQVHILTNSAMGAQLKLNVESAQNISVLAHRLAAMSKEEGDTASALAADVVVETQKQIYQDYLLRLAKSDPAAGK
jgi:predicted RNase H-related nuclease YkuK (DUF458 family)